VNPTGVSVRTTGGRVKETDPPVRATRDGGSRERNGRVGSPGGLGLYARPTRPFARPTRVSARLARPARAPPAPALTRSFLPFRGHHPCLAWRVRRCRAWLASTYRSSGTTTRRFDSSILLLRHLESPARAEARARCQVARPSRWACGWDALFRAFGFRADGNGRYPINKWSSRGPDMNSFHGGAFGSRSGAARPSR